MHLVAVRLQCCLQKDPNARWTAAQLLQHPFVRGVSLGWHSQVPYGAVRRVSDSDVQDLQQMLALVMQKHYIETNTVYAGSLFELARFERIGNELSISPSDVQRTFENMWQQHARSQSQHRQQQPQRQQQQQQHQAGNQSKNQSKTAQRMKMRRQLKILKSSRSNSSLQQRRPRSGR